jgi:osmotically-inducible protein OsmY
MRHALTGLGGFAMSAHIADSILATKSLPASLTTKVKPEADDDGPSDLILAGLVREAVTAHEALAGRPISVEVRHGWVALTGEVANATEKRLAETVVSQVPDLRGINNHLIFESDALAWKVGQKIADSFAQEGRLAAQGIMVNVHDHRVILCGTVRSPRERDAAYAACWEVPGVAEVVNRLQLKQH